MIRGTVSASRRLQLLLACAPLALGLPAHARAQDASAENEAQASDESETGNVIIVTARNRQERLQDVPLTVNAIGGEELINEGIRDLKDISFKTPALIINGGGSETLTRPSIRGLPSTSESDPTVAIYYDGAILPSSAANNIAMIDLDRVEVVKGPVNSLYGRSAYGGAINYVSKLPVNRFEGRVLGGIGNDGQRKAQAVLNLPVVDDVFMVRLASGLDNYGGGWTDPVNNLTQGGFEKRAGQVSFLLNASDRVTANGRVYYGDDTFEMNPITFMEPNCGVPVTNFPPFPHLSYTCGKFVPRPFEVNPDSTGSTVRGNNRKVWNGFFKLNFDMGVGDLTALTTYSHIKQNRLQDFVGRRAGLPFALINLADIPLGGNAPIRGTIDLTVLFGNTGTTEDFAQEFRFQSKPDKPLRLTAGAYYAFQSNINSTDIALEREPIPAGFTIRGNATTCLLFLCDRIFLTNAGEISSAKTIGRTKSDLFSFFGGVEFDPFENLTISLDGRYSMDRRELDSRFSNSAFTVVDNTGVVPVVNYIFRPVTSAINPTGAPIHADFNFFTGRASARYKFSDDGMVYATIANGVKPGGFNPRATRAEEQSFGSEKNTTYEVGFKTQAFGNRLRLNAAAFYIELSALQASGPSRFADTPGLITTNVGGATSKGFEFDADVRPIGWLTLSGGVGYADSTFDKDTFDFGFAAICTQIGSANCDQTRIVTVQSPQGPRTAFNLEGLRLQASSKWTVSAGADVEFPLSDDISFFAGGKYRHQSRQFTGTQNIVFWGPLDRFDVRAGVEYGALRVTAFVDNLTDTKTVDSVGLSSNLNDLAFIYQYATLPFRRRYGLTAEYKF